MHDLLRNMQQMLEFSRPGTGFTMELVLTPPPLLLQKQFENNKLQTDQGTEKSPATQVQDMLHLLS